MNKENEKQNTKHKNPGDETNVKRLSLPFSFRHRHRPPTTNFNSFKLFLPRLIYIYYIQVYNIYAAGGFFFTVTD